MEEVVVDEKVVLVRFGGMKVGSLRKLVQGRRLSGLGGSRGRAFILGFLKLREAARWPSIHCQLHREVVWIATRTRLKVMRHECSPK